jgi:hypothetical protein
MSVRLRLEDEIELGHQNDQNCVNFEGSPKMEASPLGPWVCGLDHLVSVTSVSLNHGLSMQSAFFDPSASTDGLSAASADGSSWDLRDVLQSFVTSCERGDSLNTSPGSASFAPHLSPDSTSRLLRSAESHKTRPRRVLKLSSTFWGNPSLPKGGTSLTNTGWLSNPDLSGLSEFSHELEAARSHDGICWAV